MATQLIAGYVLHYKVVRLCIVIGYATPADYLVGLAQEVHAERDRKLEETRVLRRVRSRDAKLAEAGCVNNNGNT
ncbi:MAG: hypothetical protein R3C05_01090 [Pirellulaceae bacterium]